MREVRANFTLSLSYFTTFHLLIHINTLDLDCNSLNLPKSNRFKLRLSVEQKEWINLSGRLSMIQFHLSIVITFRFSIYATTFNLDHMSSNLSNFGPHQLNWLVKYLNYIIVNLLIFIRLNITYREVQLFFFNICE